MSTPPLRPPLKVADAKPRRAHTGTPSEPARTPAEPVPPPPPPPPSPPAPPPAGAEVTGTRPRRPRRPLVCRECGRQEAWPAAGWFHLRRRILRNSRPPEILNEAARRRWAQDTEQWMGAYCGLGCLEKSLPRLRTLDEVFREKGTGTVLDGEGGGESH